MPGRPLGVLEAAYPPFGTIPHSDPSTGWRGRLPDLGHSRKQSRALQLVQAATHAALPLGPRD